MKYNTRPKDKDPERVQKAIEVEIILDHVVKIEAIVDQNQDQDVDLILQMKEEKVDRIAEMNKTSAVRRIIHLIVIQIW